MQENSNPILVKSKEFALNIIKAYQFLSNEKHEYVLSKQLLRSGTSIGANAKEGVKGQTKNDFYAKFNISLKEASETEYWLELLEESGYFQGYDNSRQLHEDCEELIRILVAITKTQKAKLNERVDKEKG